MPPYYLIHQPGKVGSQTLEQLIRALAPDARVERHHYLSQPRLDYLSSMCRLPGAGAGNADSILHQLSLARIVNDDLVASEPDSVWVLSGFRDPLALAQSAFFQNLPTYCPWIDYGATDLRPEVDRLIEIYGFEFERMRSGGLARTFQEALLNLKLEGPEPWFDAELNAFYGIDIYRQEIGTAPFVMFRNDRFKFCVYRAETLPDALPDLLERIGLPRVQLSRNSNVGAHKEYARLYAAFKERFRPTPGMIEYYYGGKFFGHFYRPLWTKLNEALQQTRQVDVRHASAS